MTVRNYLSAVVLGFGAAFGLAGTAVAGVSEEARAALPQAVRDLGEFRVATSLQWAPFAYRDEANNPYGVDVDLMEAIADSLGLKLVLDDVKFPAIVTGVSSGRYAAGVNQLSITEERLNAVDMVPYLHTTSVVLVRPGKEIADVNNLCGLEFVVTQGSLQAGQLTGFSEKCVAEGKPEIVQALYPNSADTLLALANGRGDGFLTAGPQAEYIASKNPKVVVNPGIVDTPRKPAGIAVKKGDADMVNAIGLALIATMEDGTYQSIFDKHGLTGILIGPDEVRAALK